MTSAWRTFQMPFNKNGWFASRSRSCSFVRCNQKLQIHQTRTNNDERNFDSNKKGTNNIIKQCVRVCVCTKQQKHFNQYSYSSPEAFYDIIELGTYEFRGKKWVLKQKHTACGGTDAAKRKKKIGNHIELNSKTPNTCSFTCNDLFSFLSFFCVVCRIQYARSKYKTQIKEFEKKQCVRIHYCSSIELTCGAKGEQGTHENKEIQRKAIDGWMGGTTIHVKCETNSFRRK